MLERFSFGDCALASVVIAPASRNAGLGALLLRHLEMLAFDRGVRTIGLLTQTAKPFFLKTRLRPRGSTGITGTARWQEFKALCPKRQRICLLAKMKRTRDERAAL